MISPQGYKLGEDPQSKNPFWGEGEDSSVNRIYATATVDNGTGVPSVTTSKKISGHDITFGFDFHNLKGEGGPAGVGVPAGGTAGQVLTKVDGTDYNTEWKDPTGGGGGGGQQIVKWVEDDTATNVYPYHSYEVANINRQTETGSSLEIVNGTMNEINYTITFSDNVTLSIYPGSQYLSDYVMLVPDARFNVPHKSTVSASLRIPDPYNDIIITAEGQTPVKAQGATLRCNIEYGSTVYVEGTISTDSGSTITIDTQALFSITSDYVFKNEVLKTV